MLSAVARGRPLATRAISTVHHGTQVPDGRECAGLSRTVCDPGADPGANAVVLSATARLGHERAVTRPGG